MEKWCEANHIMLNKQKSHFMNIKVDGRTPSYCNNIAGIDRVTQFKYLGVVFDDSLTFKQEFIDLKNHVDKWNTRMINLKKELPTTPSDVLEL